MKLFKDEDELRALKFTLITLLVMTVSPVFADPIVLDPDFTVEEVLSGLNFPVQMEFVGNDLLILQKNDGQVRLIKNGLLQEDPVLKIDVYNKGHLGLLGITSLNDSVFLYVSQNTNDNSEPVINRIYKYQWNGEKLIEPELVNELPTGSAFDHSGGVMVTGLDNNVYAIIGDTLTSNGTLQNNGGNEPDDTSVILRVGIDEFVIRPSLSENVLDHYYGIGIRNSFGLTIDPMTGNLWDTENGPESFDEINLVMPGFNSGWNKIMGPSTEDQRTNLPKYNGFTYSDPEFSWGRSLAPTGLTFVGNKWDGEYDNVLFVGDFNTGSIYKFTLNSNRTGFVFTTPELEDLVFNSGDPIHEIIFGIGFTAISDIKMGSDGSMYVLSFKDGGTLFRINPSGSQDEFLPPTKQLASGLLPYQISCKDGHVLIMKISEYKVSCVQPNTANNLIQRQWGQIIEEKLSDKCNSPPLPNVDWSGCNFSFSDLRGININGANLMGTNFVGSDLSFSKLSNSDFTRANMVFANLTNSDLSSSQLVQSKLLYSDLRNSKLQLATLTSSNLSYADLTKADLRKSNLQSAYFTNANLAYSDMTGANLHDAKLHFANLDNAILSNANLDKANFYKANLQNANLSNCKNHKLCE